jgi:hypothetical protein
MKQEVGSEVRSSFISRRARRGHRVIFPCLLPINAHLYLAQGTQRTQSRFSLSPADECLSVHDVI